MLCHLLVRKYVTSYFKRDFYWNKQLTSCLLNLYPPQTFCPSSCLRGVCVGTLHSFLLCVFKCMYMHLCVFICVGVFFAGDCYKHCPSQRVYYYPLGTFLAPLSPLSLSNRDEGRGRIRQKRGDGCITVSELYLDQCVFLSVQGGSTTQLNGRYEKKQYAILK